MTPRSSLRMNSLSSTMSTRPRRSRRPSKYDIGVAHRSNEQPAIRYVEVHGASVIPTDLLGLHENSCFFQGEAGRFDIALSKCGPVIVQHSLEHRGSAHQSRVQTTPQSA